MLIDELDSIQPRAKTIAPSTSVNNGRTRRGGIQAHQSLAGLQMGAPLTSLAYNQTERSSIISGHPRADFFNNLNQESLKIERLKERQEEITLKKLEKEAVIRQRNLSLQKKYEKLQKFEQEYKRELYAKSIQMSQKREQKIHEMKAHEEQKERQLQREHEKLMQQLHEKAKNITMIELEKQKELRRKEEE